MKQSKAFHEDIRRVWSRLSAGSGTSRLVEDKHIQGRRREDVSNYLYDLKWKKTNGFETSRSTWLAE